MASKRTLQRLFHNLVHILVYQVLVDVFSTTPSSFRFLFWWTFFGGRLVSHFFWWTFFGGRLVGHFFGGHNLKDLFLTD